MRTISMVVAAMLLSVPAMADDGPTPVQVFSELTAGFPMHGNEADEFKGPPPRFVFTESAAVVSPADFNAASSQLGQFASPQDGAVSAKALDGSASWIAVDIEYSYPCGMAGCPGRVFPVVHASGVLEPNGRAVAWHLGTVVVEHDGKKRFKVPPTVAPPALSTGIDAGAEDLAKAFQTAAADPQTLAAAISDRSDVVLFGSEKPERYVGGAKVKAQLAKWNLGMTLRDGVQAGLVSKTVGWVAMNVDAAKKGAKKAKKTPYRVFAIVEKKDAAWQVVALHFSSVFKK